MTYPLTALISDLHANIPALETAVADARERGVQRFVCLGDVVGYGAQPLECLDEVMKLCTAESRFGGLEPGLCLQGNHEYALLASAEDFNDKARAAIEWTREAIGAGGDRGQAHAYWDFLGSLEPALDDGIAMYAHGSPRDPVREYLLPRDARDTDKMGALFGHMKVTWPEARVCFVGHSHVPGLFYEDGRYYRPRDTEGPYALFEGGEDDESGAESDGRVICNVGSVGQPRDGDPRLSYALFDGSAVTFVRLDYDIATAQAAIRSVPELPDYLAERLEQGR